MLNTSIKSRDNMDQKHEPLVSVITPTYNHEDFIGDCIESVLNQSFKNWEMIIIDDGSTDKTPSIVSSYDDNRIRFKRQKNIGIMNIYKTLNKALKLSRGKYIAILPGDDLWPKDKLEKQLQTFDDNTVLSHGKVIKVDSNNKKISNPLPSINFNKKIFRNEPVGKVLKILLFKNYIRAPTTIIQKKAIKKIGGFKQINGVPGSGYTTWLELSLVGKFSATNEIFSYYRRHKNQVSQTYNMAQVSELICNYVQNDFIEKIPPSIKESKDFNEDVLIKKLRRKIVWRYFKAGRKALLNKDWNKGRNFFWKALKHGPPLMTLTTKIQSLIGLIFSFFKKEIDLAKFPGSGLS